MVFVGKDIFFNQKSLLYDLFVLSVLYLPKIANS
jgi:hypothetical protein